MISIDPGTRALGWALWDHGRLVEAGASIAPETAVGASDLARAHLEAIRAWGGPPGADVALEIMEWRRGDARSQPADLLVVQAVGCLVAGGIGGPVALYAPSKWKGTIPKEVHHERIRETLGPTERAVLSRAEQRTRASNRKEVLDAVGIGLYHLKRTNRSGGTRR